MFRPVQQTEKTRTGSRSGNGTTHQVELVGSILVPVEFFHPDSLIELYIYNHIFQKIGTYKNDVTAIDRLKDQVNPKLKVEE